MLFEGGQAATDGMPSSVDDTSVRQNHPDETQMEPVIRHFVDEYKFNVRLSGVPLEWKKQERVVVTASADRVRESLRKVEDVQH